MYSICVMMSVLRVLSTKYMVDVGIHTHTLSIHQSTYYKNIQFTLYDHLYLYKLYNFVIFMVVEQKHYFVTIDVVFIHSCIEKHLDWLYDLNTLSMAVSLKGKNEELFIYIPNGGITGSHDISIFIIWSKKVHTDFPEGWTDVHSYQQGTMPSLSIQIFFSSCLISQWQPIRLVWERISMWF